MWLLAFPVLLAFALFGPGTAAPATATGGDSETVTQDSPSVVDPCAEKHHNGPVSAEEAAEEAAACAAQPVPPEPPPSPLSCEGAVLCMATEDEARAAGLDVDAMRRDDRDALATVLAQHEAELKQSGVMSTSSSSYYSAWVNFYLYQSSAGYCSGTLNYNSHCGWLYHRYYDDASGWLYTTSFPARSGNNNPSSDWSYGGPIPNDHQPAGGSVTNHYKWGFMNGTYYGYQADSSATFDPGKWRLDPWYVNQPGTSAPPYERRDRKSTRLNSSHIPLSRMPSSA